MWLVWKNTLNNVVEKHAPLRTRRVRSSTCKSPWITPELKQHMHKRDILKLKAIRSKDQLMTEPHLTPGSNVKLSMRRT
jgi:hypothetical protein